MCELIFPGGDTDLQACGAVLQCIMSYSDESLIKLSMIGLKGIENCKIAWHDIFIIKSFTMKLCKYISCDLINCSVNSL